MVQEALANRVIEAQHRASGRFGHRHLLRELRRRIFCSPQGLSRQGCRGGDRALRGKQKCNTESSSLKMAERMKSIIDQFMASVCLDIFTMPWVQLRVEEYDRFMLCVYLLTGRSVARPFLRLVIAGITREKAAHLLTDGSWGKSGIPAVINTDQDPRFVNAVFFPMCSRLGLRCTFPRAHGPKANGRVEVAGKSYV